MNQLSATHRTKIFDRRTPTEAYKSRNTNNCTALVSSRFLSVWCLLRTGYGISRSCHINSLFRYRVLNSHQTETDLNSVRVPKPINILEETFEHNNET